MVVGDEQASRLAAQCSKLKLEAECCAYVLPPLAIDSTVTLGVLTN